MAQLSKLIVATLNKHKVEEIQAWFTEYRIEILALSGYTREMPPETGATFAENAYLKAQYGYTLTGLPTLADDSGLEVDALGGAPGVFSARYSGKSGSDEDNNRKLLAELHNTTGRTAQFRCSMALVMKDAVIEVDGACSGVILPAPRGSGGFGYDPLFWLPELNLTMAELSQEQKNAISHRGRALSNLTLALVSRGLIG